MTRFLICCSLAFIFPLCHTTSFAQNNGISGMIFDARSRLPVPQVSVEILNELGQTIKRTRVESSGRFSFGGIPAGTYSVRVITFGTDYEEQTQEINLINFSRQSANGGITRSSDAAYLDFYLRVDPRRRSTGSPGVPSAVFSQAVPPDAEKQYKKGIELLAKKDDEGLESLARAIQIFPGYYDALDRLGTEYTQRKDYQRALPLLIRAIDVNPRSFSSYYAIGIISLNLGQIRDAIAALSAAVTLNAESINAELMYGMALRLNNDLEKAEKALLNAKRNAKNVRVPDIHWQLALLYQKKERYAEAADELESYLKAQTTTPTNVRQVRSLIEDLRTKAAAKK